MPPYTISAVSSPTDLKDTITLFEAYATGLQIDLAFQDFATEMQSMPGKYAPPSGELLLARNAAGEAIGCVALRSLGNGCCEMKRLYVDPRGRGLGLGKALAETVICEARTRGYVAMRLDTLRSMRAARRLYEDLGFREITAYYRTPIEDTVFLELTLQV